jgi:hypothetical protein
MESELYEVWGEATKNSASGSYSTQSPLLQFPPALIVTSILANLALGSSLTIAWAKIEE